MPAPSHMKSKQYPIPSFNELCGIGLMLRSEAHHAEARRCRSLAGGIPDEAARTLLCHMATLHDTMAAGAIKGETGPHSKIAGRQARSTTRFSRRNVGLVWNGSNRL